MLEADLGPGLGKRLQFSPDRVPSGLTEKHHVSLLGLLEAGHLLRLIRDDLLAVYQSSDAVLTSQRGSCIQSKSPNIFWEESELSQNRLW